MVKEEAKVREKAKLLVKKKLDTKLEGLELSEDAFIELEKELLDDLEETIQNQLSIHRKFILDSYQHGEDNLEIDDFNVDDYDDTDIPRFYWGGEDLCEMMFYDETS